MATAPYPQLVLDYLKYVDHKRSFGKTGKIDLSDVRFIYPTTFLPLSDLIVKHPSSYIEPSNPDTANYIQTIMNPHGSNAGKTYVPIVELPREQKDDAECMKRVYVIQRHGDFGGESAFKYVVGELVDNMYQHSKFTRALIMGQRYNRMGFTDLSFFDDGITIPKTYDPGPVDDASSLIRKALNGVSSRSGDRGFGLRTSYRLFTEGVGAEFFIVSGTGAVYLDKNNDEAYRLTPVGGLDGTLITIRVPTGTRPVNIYDYVE